MKNIKYKMGQKVFHLMDNTVCEGHVIGIVITNKRQVYYKLSWEENGESTFEGSDDMGKVYNWENQDSLFPTKKALIDQL